MNGYFDNAAAVPADEDALKDFLRFSADCYGNQESPGFCGQRAAAAIGEAEERIQSLLLGEDHRAEMLWISSGTEALNALFAILRKRFPGGGEIVYTDGEHVAFPAALERMLPPEKFPRRKVPLLKDGAIDREGLKEILSGKTLLLALHHVQPETGRIQDLCGARECLDRTAPGALFFSDSVQSACKMPIPWREARLDFAMLSGQKFGAPSGGALFCRGKRNCSEVRRLRKEAHAVGRVPPPVILTLTEQVRRLVPRMGRNAEKMNHLKRIFLNTLSAELGEERFSRTIPDEAESSPYIQHLLIRQCQGAILCRALALSGFSVSPGSACNAETDTPSAVLKAMGFGKRAYEALRISFAPHNTEEETVRLAREIASAVRNY